MGGYRSIREVQAVGRLAKVTLFAGQNNAGKSNVLRFVSDFLRQPPSDDWHNIPQPPGPPVRMQIAYETPTAESLEHLKPGFANGQLAKLLEHDAFHSVAGSDDIWLQYAPEEGTRGQQRQWVLDRQHLESLLLAIGHNGSQILQDASGILTGTGGGQPTDDINRVLSGILPLVSPPTARVEAFRQISPGDENSDPEIVDQNGRNLVKRLADLRDPPVQEYQAKRARFDAINRFARSVFEDAEVSIEIPAAQNDIHIRQHGRVLPLASMGTGIHQVIIIAAAATTLDRTVVCVEEPEINLHPLLQRKLVRYLSEATSNQYLIATHSAHMLDYDRAAVIHVRHKPSEGTVLYSASSPQDVSNICADLGYRPSDLIQANCVIWVEGPSDRIYLNRWLEIVTPGEFVEGIHYSVMFYGGGLLRHLTADDPSVDEFVSLRRLNRHSAIMIDSDKASESDSINSTKQRVCAEFAREDMPGLAWVTDWRTIENYVPLELLTESVAEVHKRSIYTPPADGWDQPLKLASSKGNPSQPDKVKVARVVCSRWPEGPLPGPLAARVAAVADFIRAANGEVAQGFKKAAT